MIWRIKKDSSHKKTTLLRTEYTKNSVLISPEEIVFLSSDGNLEISKGQKSNKNTSLDIEYEYRKPYLQISNEDGNLSINSMYFLDASTSDFYSSMIDKGDGEEKEYEYTESLETLGQRLYSFCGSSSFYIINKECKLLTAANLVDGLVQHEFDIRKASKRKNPEDIGYDYMMITSTGENIDARFFSIRVDSNRFALKTKKIPIHQIGIYDVIKEASNKEIDNIESISIPAFKKKGPIKMLDISKK